MAFYQKNSNNSIEDENVPSTSSLCISKYPLKDSDEEEYNSNNSVKRIKLPGGYIEPILVKEQPKNITKKLRRYLDILYSVIAEATIGSSKVEFSEIIPIVVDHILQYNNIFFKHINLYKIKQNLFEPLWYEFQISQSKLTLFLDEELKNKFCAKTITVPVIFTSGHFNLSKFDPFCSKYTVDDFNPQSNAITNCITLCDHLCTHIISEWYHQQNNEKLSDVESLHYHFTKYGTTLHTIFDLTCHKDKCKDFDNSSGSLLTNLNSTHNFSQSLFDFING